MNRVVGRGWATVELERAASELAGSLAPDTLFEAAPRSAILGARCLRGRAGHDFEENDGGADWIVLLEPDTEGRLAAFLARSGEGWAATWTMTTSPKGTNGAPGPLGEERLDHTRRAAGPYRLLLSAATIEP
ncbi:MAG TPA: hypothetical protein VHK05_00910 [Candidatus Limnocylindrales bacterium]|nr:hypothetical protein [Candidatus Limnocylindrales bacterium]